MKTPVLLLAVLAVGVLDARSRWVRLMSSHFEVLTDAGERAGREVLARFEQIRQAYGPGRASPLPVRVYVFSRESDFAPFRPAKSTEGFYQSSAERDFIAMHLAGAESYRVVFHEYVHLVLNHSSSRMPIWFEEGLAEFYSTLKFESNRLRVGGVIPVHVATLANQKWLTASQLAALTKSSPYYNEEGRTAVFYAQSWALVHMLHTSPAWRDGLERYVDLLAETVEPDRAFRQAFGRTLAGALADLEDVIRTRRFPVAEGPWEPREVAPPIIEAVAEAVAEMARAELFHATGKSKNALEIYTKLAARAGESVQLETALGRLALAGNAYGGVGVPDCVRSGERAAEALLAS